MVCIFAATRAILQPWQTDTTRPRFGQEETEVTEGHVFLCSLRCLMFKNAEHDSPNDADELPPPWNQ